MNRNDLEHIEAPAQQPQYAAAPPPQYAAAPAPQYAAAPAQQPYGALAPPPQYAAAPAQQYAAAPAQQPYGAPVPEPPAPQYAAPPPQYAAAPPPQYAAAPAPQYAAAPAQPPYGAPVPEPPAPPPQYAAAPPPQYAAAPAPQYAAAPAQQPYGAPAPPPRTLSWAPEGAPVPPQKMVFGSGDFAKNIGFANGMFTVGDLVTPYFAATLTKIAQETVIWCEEGWKGPLGSINISLLTKVLKTTGMHGEEIGATHKGQPLNSIDWDSAINYLLQQPEYAPAFKTKVWRGKAQDAKPPLFGSGDYLAFYFHLIDLRWEGTHVPGPMTLKIQTWKPLTKVLMDANGTQDVRGEVAFQAVKSGQYFDVAAYMQTPRSLREVAGPEFAKICGPRNVGFDGLVYQQDTRS